MAIVDKTIIADAAGDVLEITAANAAKVDGSAVTQPVSLVSVPSHAVTNAGTFAVQDSEKIADNAGFTDGTSKVLPAGFIYDEVAGTSLTENDVAAARINANRAQVQTIEDGSTRGRYATVTVANALKVDNSGVTQPVSISAGSALVGKMGIDQTTPGTTNGVVEASAANALTSLQLIDDVIYTSGDSLSKVAGIGAQFDDVSPGAVTENKIAPVRMSSRREMYTTLRDAAGNERGLNINNNGAANVVLADETTKIIGQVYALQTASYQVIGDIAHDYPDSGYPVKIGMKATNALPTAVSNADRANAISDLYGRQLTAHIDPAMQIWKSYNDTSSRAAGSAQILWTPAAGKKIVITSIDISTYGTTSGRIFVFFAAAADLTYTAGTDQPVFVGSFAPSANSKPGVVKAPPVPIISANADYKLYYQNDAAISVDIVVYGYEI